MPQSQGISSNSYSEPINQIPHMDTNFFAIHSNIFQSSWGIFPDGLRIKILKALLTYFIVSTCPSNLWILYFITLCSCYFKEKLEAEINFNVQTCPKKSKIIWYICCSQQVHKQMLKLFPIWQWDRGLLWFPCTTDFLSSDRNRFMEM